MQVEVSPGWKPMQFFVASGAQQRRYSLPTAPTARRPKSNQYVSEGSRRSAVSSAGFLIPVTGGSRKYLQFRP